MKHQAVIFDCDGVMFDSRQANTNLYNHLLSHFGLDLMLPEDIEFVHMHTVVESIRRIFRNTPHTDDALEYRLHLDYTPFIADMVMEPGLRELLDFLKPRCGLAVATNRSNTIGKVLERNNLSQYFDIVVSSLDVENPKPHPESVFKILDFFGLGPDRCFYVGDSAVDSEVCRAAHVPLIAYKNKALEAMLHVENMPELQDALKHLRTFAV
jgi:phosphoglycolate phosphatase